MLPDVRLGARGLVARASFRTGGVPPRRHLFSRQGVTRSIRLVGLGPGIQRTSS
jgi:hypothetical protein